MWRITMIRRTSSRTTTRFLSSTTLASPLVISRRAWQAYRQKKNPLDGVPKVTSKSADDNNKPWPKSVIYMGYVAAGIFIPYFCTWFIASNPPVRKVVFQKVPLLEKPIRSHFGTQDPDAVSYVDSLEQGIPLRLADEWPEKIRQEQAVIDKLNDAELKVKIHCIQDGTQSSSDVLQVPASTLARKQDLLSFIDAKEYENISIAVDFQTVIANEAEEMSNDLSDENVPKDPLLQTASIYSSWHYQQDMTAIQQTTSISDSQVKQSALEHRIQELERELKNPTRVVDDIVEELNSTKAELRSLRWKKWMPWS